MIPEDAPNIVDPDGKNHPTSSPDPCQMKHTGLIMGMVEDRCPSPVLYTPEMRVVLW